MGSDQGQKFLYVVNDKNKAVYTQVTCGPLRRDKRAIISGLKSTDRFRGHRLAAGQGGDAVDPQEEKAKEQESKDADWRLPAVPAATAQVKTVSRQEVR